jgi:peptidoglycan/xylan/chitin deacetylase (PgdA/CDA1 family)
MAQTGAEKLDQVLQEILQATSHDEGFAPRAKHLLKKALHRTGVGPAIARLKGPRASVLIYHKVERRDRGPFGAPALDVHRFSQHLEFLGRHFDVMPLARLVAELRKGQVPERAVAITFDDGYRNNLTLAYPLLRKWRMPATVFVTAGLIGTKKWMWTSEVTEMALRYGLSAVASACGDRLLAALLEAELPKAMRVEAAVEYLVRLGPPREAILARLRESFPVDPDDENGFLSWDEVRALHAGGVEIGSHTVNHPVLTELPEVNVERELKASSEAIGDVIGRKPELFCYPHGNFSDSVKALTKRYYGAAVTTISGQNTARTDPLELRRIAAYSVEELGFELARAH